MLSSIRSFADFLRLRHWEKRTSLRYAPYSESLFVYGFRRIPWAGVTFVLFLLVTFGLDFTCGLSAAYTRMEKSLETEEDVANRFKSKQRLWSKAMAQDFRNGKFQFIKSESDD